MHDSSKLHEDKTRNTEYTAGRYHGVIILSVTLLSSSYNNETTKIIAPSSPQDYMLDKRKRHYGRKESR